MSFHAQLASGHCDHDRGRDRRARSNSGHSDFGLPIDNGDEAVKKQCEEAAPKPAVSKPACMAAGALQEKQSRDELAKIWNTLDSSIRLQCSTNRSVDSYSSLKQCIEHERGR